MVLTRFTRRNRYGIAEHFLRSTFSRATVCQQTIRLKPGDQTFNTEASAVWLNFVKSAYFSRDFFDRGSFFQAFPNDYRSLIQLVITPRTKVYQDAVAAIEFCANYLIFRH
jgi:hypothetical protein